MSIDKDKAKDIQDQVYSIAFDKYQAGWVVMAWCFIELQYPTSQAREAAEKELKQIPGVQIFDGASNPVSYGDAHDLLHHRVHWINAVC